MTPMRNDETVRTYFRCLDSEDWATMMPLWHADAELRAVGARPRHGRDDVIAYFARLFGAWATHTDVPTRLIASASTIVAEVTFTGTTVDGRNVSFDAVDIFDLEVGLIRRLSNWYDIAYVRRQLSAEERTI